MGLSQPALGLLKGILASLSLSASAGLLLDAGALLRPSAARLTVLTPGCGRAYASPVGSHEAHNALVETNR